MKSKSTLRAIPHNPSPQPRSNIENFKELWSTLVEISKAIKHNNVLVQKYRNELEDDTVATEKINSTIQLAAEPATISLKTAKKTERHDLLIKSLQDELQETKIDLGIFLVKIWPDNLLCQLNLSLTINYDEKLTNIDIFI